MMLPCCGKKGHPMEKNQSGKRRLTRWQIVLSVLLVLALLLVCFIFYNSLLDQAESAELSNGLLAVLKPFLQSFLKLSDQGLHRLIRKTAHFTEFFCLGALLGAATFLYRSHTGEKVTTLTFFLVLICAVTDEMIQSFNDRSAEYRDVLLDFAGGCAGILLILFVLVIVCKSRKRVPALNGIHHIAILCSDREKSLSFYADALGFTIRGSHVRAERRDEVIFLDGFGVTLELFIASDHPQRVTRPEAYGLRHIAFRVPSAESCHTALTMHGYDPEQIRIDTFNGKKLFFCTDPDGLPIEFHE